MYYYPNELEKSGPNPSLGHSKCYLVLKTQLSYDALMKEIKTRTAYSTLDIDQPLGRAQVKKVRLCKSEMGDSYELPA